MIGLRDLEKQEVSVREHGKDNLGAKPRDEVIAEIPKKISTRAA